MPLAKRFLDDQTKQLKIQAPRNPSRRCSTSRNGERIVEVTDKASIAENNLAAANAAAGQLISERMKNEQLWRQVGVLAGYQSAQFLANPVIEVLRGQRKAFETEYQEKRETFLPSYPAMVQNSKQNQGDRQAARGGNWGHPQLA